MFDQNTIVVIKATKYEIDTFASQVVQSMFYKSSPVQVLQVQSSQLLQHAIDFLQIL